MASQASIPRPISRFLSLYLLLVVFVSMVPAITLVYVWPCRAEGWQWGDDIRHSRTIRGTGDYLNQVNVRCGATGTNFNSSVSVNRTSNEIPSARIRLSRALSCSEMYGP